MNNKSEILQKLSSNLKRFADFGVLEIGVFGSILKNDNDMVNDLDILVSFDKGSKSFDNYFDLKFFLESLFKINVDLVMKNKLKAEIRDEILESVIYAA